MSEYIDRHELLKAINEDRAEAHNERCAQILEAILNAPTADVVEVRHGRWILKDNNGNGVCSVCNRQDKIDELATHCRYCGAKIDGEGREV